MKTYTFHAIIYFFWSIFSITSLHATKTKRQPRFITFDTKDGQIDIDLDLSIPFITIPLKPNDDFNGPQPLVNVNLKSITVAGVLAAMAAFFVPLLINKTPNDQHYRMDDGFGLWEAGKTVNELILGNNYVTPCVQRAVCGTIAKINDAMNPSGTDKIIDGISKMVPKYDEWYSYSRGNPRGSSIKITLLTQVPAMYDAYRSIPSSNG